jgi:hypothetical protein
MIDFLEQFFMYFASSGKVFAYIPKIYSFRLWFLKLNTTVNLKSYQHISQKRTETLLFSLDGVSAFLIIFLNDNGSYYLCLLRFLFFGLWDEINVIWGVLRRDFRKMTEI